jgi:predicted AlkP superfamily phosphohydrolase/phosphomutase
MPTKLFLLGLDSASVTLVRRCIASGDLPNLRALRQEGAWGILTSPPGLGDDAAWASFSTCTIPGAHGRFYFRSVQPGSYEYQRVQDSHRKRESFWDALGRQGLRTAVVDVPKCPLSTEINGLHLTDWHVHGRDNVTRSFPPELAPQVLHRYGDDRTDRPGTKDWLCRLEKLEEAKLEQFLEHLLESIERKTMLAEELLARKDWDLFLLVFKEAHCAGHQCWHLVDPVHPAYSAVLAERLANPLLRVYRALDRAVGKLRALLSPDADLLLFSDLDMGPNYTGEHILDDILKSLVVKI